ncbi:hypothetical protein BK816_03225 [Boudabousia tangfeifanii]|uniref:YoaR-like putative peptidoglycan binding domain-containing protein n=1 Tax=Boudabousia tangfeifanii TaxID=1912795 RepID=A0A1D9MJR3_9ACTO|nr:hypothetical protein BK816_03225 [Boudabousia tangfeifanii]
MAWAVSDKIPAGISVFGLSLGNEKADDAIAQLEAKAQEREQQEITVTAGEKEAKTTAQKLGISIDARETLAELTGFSLNPRRIWQHFANHPVAELAVKTDQEKQNAELKNIANALNTDVENANLSFAQTEVNVSPAVSGIQVDEAKTFQKILVAWQQDELTVAADYSEVGPKITTEQAEDEKNKLAQPIVAGNVQLKLPEGTLEVEPTLITANTTFDNSGDKLVMNTNWEEIAKTLRQSHQNLLPEPVSASFAFDGGVPKVVPGKVGKTIIPQELQKSMETAWLSANRQADLTVTEQTPEFDDQAASGMGVKEVVGEFTTPYYSEPGRDQNLRRGMTQITGKLIKPGETFSLEKALGDISEANGYANAGVISDGMHIDAMGGGLSQVCVTTLNAAFFAGLDIVEHKPHSKYFRRYPAGRECTLWTGTHDLKVKNNTPHGVVLWGQAEGGKMTVKAWSTKYWEVKESTSDHRNIVKPKTEYRLDRNCEPSGAGNAGFTVRVTREITHDGKPGEPIDWTWTYQPDNRIVCGPRPKPKPKKKQTVNKEKSAQSKNKDAKAKSDKSKK